jgi:Domain of unknown function (DUF3331)
MHQGDVMIALLCNDPWQQVVSELQITSAPDACCNETKSVRHRSQGRSSDSRLKASWLSASRSNDEGVELLPIHGRVTILERRSLTTIVVSWCDATSGHCGDQIWTTGIAQKRAMCALTGAHIRRGDAVYRPRRSRAHLPANTNGMILASALLERESVATVDIVTRASTEPASPKRCAHHSSAAGRSDGTINAEAVQR